MFKANALCNDLGVDVDMAGGAIGWAMECYQRGILTEVNLIVATQNNAAAICMDVEKAAKSLIHKGEVSDGLLNMIEMAFRAYDPCFSCATHCFPGQMPMILEIRETNGELLQSLIRD